MMTLKLPYSFRNCKFRWSTAWFLAVLAVSSVQLMAFAHVAVLTTNRVHTLLLVCVTELMVIYLPYWFLRPKWRWSLLMPVWLLTFWMLTNLWYLRYYHDLMPLGSYLMWGNLDGMLIDSALSVVRCVDVLVFLLALALQISYCVVFRRYVGAERGYSGRDRVAAASVVIVCWLLEQLFFCVQDYRDFIAERPVSFTESVSEHYGDISGISRSSMIRHYGFVFYWADDIVSMMQTTHKLSDSERKAIDDFIERNRQDGAGIAANRGKNLIFIIVESLNADVVGLTIGGREVTPVLNGLSRDDNIMVALNMATQAGCGRSSDGQLMYNTGLLPLRDEPAVLRYANRDWPSIAGALEGYDSMEVIGESGGLWNHVETNKGYGYDCLVEKSNLLAGPKEQVDSMVFATAIARIARMREPFFVEVTTLSMHEPYDYGKVPPSWLDKVDGVTEKRRNYLSAVSYFDRQLGLFIEELKRLGVWGRTVVAIASDHAQDSALGDADNGGRIVFMVANAGCGLKCSEQIGQIDVYPTLLDVMGADDYAWRGLGRSLLRDGWRRDAGELFGGTVWQVSESIIKSDYFEKNEAY